MTPRQREHNQRTLARGKRHFILVTGGVGWGLTVAAGTVLWQSLEQNQYSLSKIYLFPLLLRLAFSFPFFFAGGCLWGWCMWKFLVWKQSRTLVK